MTDLIPTISMQTLRYEDGSYGVQVTLTGLGSERQAEAAMEHIQQMFCGPEIKTQ